eukprot:scaffold4862_cov144-Skeletonema_dohrnii-CCMP3373.AAC.4
MNIFSACRPGARSKHLYAFWSAQRLDRERTLHAGISTTRSVAGDRIVNPKLLCSFYLSGDDDWQLKQMYHKDYREMELPASTRCNAAASPASTDTQKSTGIMQPE